MNTVGIAASSACVYMYLDLHTYLATYYTYKVKVKFSRYRPEQALGDPGG